MRHRSRYLSAPLTLVLLLQAGWSRAQPPAAPFEVGVQLAVAHSGEFERSDAGIGVRGGWRPSGTLGLEAEVTLYPSDYPGAAAFSGHRIEGLVGATLGPQIGRLRPFGRARAGFLRFGSAPEPIACIAVVPPPLACRLAPGRTVFALDLGGGIEGRLTARTFWRLDLGDRLVRYPGPTLGRGLRARDAFVGHDFRLAAGGGFRF